MKYEAHDIIPVGFSYKDIQNISEFELPQVTPHVFFNWGQQRKEADVRSNEPKLLHFSSCTENLNSCRDIKSIKFKNGYLLRVLLAIHDTLK